MRPLIFSRLIFCAALLFLKDSVSSAYIFIILHSIVLILSNLFVHGSSISESSVFFCLNYLSSVHVTTIRHEIPFFSQAFLFLVVLAFFCHIIAILALKDPRRHKLSLI